MAGAIRQLNADLYPSPDVTVTVGSNRLAHVAAPQSLNAALGIGCIGLFLLPFAAVGVGTASLGVRRIFQGNWHEGLIFTLFGVVFAGFAAGGVAALQVGRRKLKEEESLRALHPDQPWLWRKDWASGRINDSSAGAMWASCIFAIFWNLVSLPVGFVGVRAALQEGNRAGFVALLFPLVGIVLLVRAIRATLRYKKHGVSRLELLTTPGTIGRSVAGTIRVSSILNPENGFDVKLSCIRRGTTGSGKNSSTTETILWQEESRVRAERSRDPAGLSMRVPIAFRIPADAQPSESSSPRDQITWRLEVSASVPGVDYASVFEVPVFRTPASELPLSQSEDGSSAEQLLRRPDYRQPPDSRIVVTQHPRGTEIVFSAARNPGAAIGLTLFTMLWTCVVVALVYAGAPMVFPIVFGFFELLLVIGTLQLWFGVSRVTANPDTLVIADGYIYAGRERRFGAEEVTDVTTTIGMQAGSRPYYDVVIRFKHGKRVTAGRSVRDKREAEWLAATIKKALAGRRGEVPASHDR